MAAVASSSRLAVPRPASRSRKPDVFKPRFPLDPFAGVSATALGEPWFLKIDTLLAATAHQRRNVIFVLGAPTLKELAPLFQSQHLSNSLVILATHNPPDIPHIVLPTVRILHLSGPLALEDAGAVRFVNVLEWAERIARTWRKHGGSGVLELSEELDIHGELAPPNVLRFSGSQSTPNSPGSSSTHLSSEFLLPSRPTSLFRPLSSSSGRFTRSRKSSQNLPRPDPSQRPFDVLINFLPADVSDKALLKNSILVTTISRPFLVSNGPAPPALRSRTTSSSSTRFQRPQSIFGAFTRSSSSVYLPPTPPYQSGESLNLSSATPPPPAKALLLHLLPPPPPNAQFGPRRKLVQSMESFLVSFALQTITPGAIGGEMLERGRPYVMQASTFCETVGCEPGIVDWGDWTVADIVLSGALDAETAPGSVGTSPASGSAQNTGAGKARAMPTSKTSRRAWIATAADLVIMPSSDEPSSSSSSSPDARPARPESSYFPGNTHMQHNPRSISESLPRALDKGARSSSAPLPTSVPDWHARPLSHPHPHHMTAAHSAPHVLSRQRSPFAGVGERPLPTPPRSEESACTSSSSAASPRGSSTGSSAHEKSEKKPGWKFWRRLSHMPAAIRA
ncbi:hypothetical protein TRAPUB_267 [Trametes pubescens]|uniref:Uncharacterized protein n=1 Tax=Trametes pubescens TaxID=154538 RepID=A0A1M2VMR3_TRAPU|nr:hypothetical protein TRAPUB_267 [Trametes pubescens]